MDPNQQQNIAVESGLSTAPVDRSALKDSISLERALGDIKAAIPSARELSPEASSELFTKLFGPEMGATVANQMMKAGVESARLTPTANGFQVDVKLRNDISFNVADELENVIAQQKTPAQTADEWRAKVKGFDFSKIALEREIGFNVGIDSSQGKLNVTPSPGKDSIGIGLGAGFGFATAYSYGEEVSISADKLQFVGNLKNGEMIFKEKDGVQLAARGMSAFAESLGSV